VGMYNFCYYNALGSFAPDELSFHTAHPLFTAPRIAARAVIIEEYFQMSKAGEHISLVRKTSRPPVHYDQ
jgi:hypothetical protein